MKPTYRDEWLVPGGVIEDGESPREACIREIQEEIGIDVRLGRLLCIEYGSGDLSRTESLQFIFFGEVLTDERIATIRIARDEIVDFQIVSAQEAMSKLAPRLAMRIGLALVAADEERTIYAEDGREMA